MSDAIVVGAQGITDAFRDAQLLAEAVDEGLSHPWPLDDALAEYEQRRNEVATPIFEFVCQQATLMPPPPEMAALLGALRGNQADTNRLFGMIENAVPVAEFFGPESVGQIMGRAGVGA